MQPGQPGPEQGSISARRIYHVYSVFTLCVLTEKRYGQTQGPL